MRHSVSFSIHPIVASVSLAGSFLMLNDLIVYCALNSNADNLDNAADAAADDLVDRLFNAITNNPSTSTSEGVLMSWADHLKRNNRATIPYSVQSLAFFHSEWAEGFLGWHDGDCSASTYVVRYEECQVNWRYRECFAGLEWSPRWGGERFGLDTCGHE